MGFQYTAGLPNRDRRLGFITLEKKRHAMINGIKWGTNIKDLPDMALVGAFGGGKRIYTRKGENKKIGDADIEVVMYGFYKDRLEDMQIHFRSSANFEKLKEILYRVYGSGRQPIRSLETYHWYGNQTSIFLAYNKFLGKGAIGYTFMPIYKQEREDRKLAQEKYTEMVGYFKNLKKYAPKLVGRWEREGEGSS
ncbi:MAG: hypothetical protein GTO16_10765 [Candidatus Aminicenantes bacterium]|nr:hypothetical protein [Candidatus Aminicenantes bacterium]NIN93176.1 hypothetical protein [bacterium]